MFLKCLMIIFFFFNWSNNILELFFVKFIKRTNIKLKSKYTKY